MTTMTGGSEDSFHEGCYWVETYDLSSEAPYYYHIETKESRWEKPEELNKFEQQMIDDLIEDLKEPNDAQKEAVDKESGMTYFFHSKTKKTRWENPSQLQNQAESIHGPGQYCARDPYSRRLLFFNPDTGIRRQSNAGLIKSETSKAESSFDTTSSLHLLTTEQKSLLNKNIENLNTQNSTLTSNSVASDERIPRKRKRRSQDEMRMLWDSGHRRLLQQCNSCYKVIHRNMRSKHPCVVQSNMIEHHADEYYKNESGSTIHYNIPGHDVLYENYGAHAAASSFIDVSDSSSSTQNSLNVSSASSSILVSEPKSFQELQSQNFYLVNNNCEPSLLTATTNLNSVNDLGDKSSNHLTDTTIPPPPNSHPIADTLYAHSNTSTQELNNLSNSSDSNLYSENRFKNSSIQTVSSDVNQKLFNQFNSSTLLTNNLPSSFLEYQQSTLNNTCFANSGDVNAVNKLSQIFSNHQNIDTTGLTNVNNNINGNNKYVNTNWLNSSGNNRQQPDEFQRFSNSSNPTSSISINPALINAANFDPSNIAAATTALGVSGANLIADSYNFDFSNNLAGAGDLNLYHSGSGNVQSSDSSANQSNGDSTVNQSVYNPNLYSTILQNEQYQNQNLPSQQQQQRHQNSFLSQVDFDLNNH